jgi:hypothetical protein
MHSSQIGWRSSIIGNNPFMCQGTLRLLRTGGVVLADPAGRPDTVRFDGAQDIW